MVMDTADVEDDNNTASVSSSTSFNVNTAHCVQLKAELLNTKLMSLKLMLK